MSFNFPNAPIQGQVFTPAGGYQYVYIDGVWRVVQTAPNFVTAQSRNRIVNGAMQISQEQGDTGSGLAATGSFYPADQWLGGWSLSPGTATIQRIAGPSPNGSAKAIYHQVGTALATMGGSNFFFIQHPIEGNRMADFQWGTASAKQAVLRFWAWVQVAGTYSIQIQNSAADRSFIAAFTVAGGEASTWKQHTIVIPGDITGTWLKDTGIGMYLRFVWASAVANQGVAGWQAGNKIGAPGQTNGAATASTNFQIADVGLYLDPLATGIAPPWVMPDEAEEMRTCQRYYERMRMVISTVANSANMSWVTKRVNPAMSLSPDSGSGGSLSTTGPSSFYQWVAHSAVATATAIGNARM